jgi:hypothetical protein
MPDQATHIVVRGQQVVHLHPVLLQTLHAQFKATQDGSGITFESYLGQLLETVAADLRLPNCKSIAEAPHRAGHHNGAIKTNSNAPRFSREALERARELSSDPNEIARLMAKMVSDAPK